MVEAFPRRVLMTTDTVGGVFDYALELCAGLAEAGVSVRLVAMGRPLADDQHAALSRLRGLRVDESAYRLEWMRDPWRDVDAAGEWLLEIEDELRPDVVHLNGYAHAALPFRARKVVVAHSCVKSWWRQVRGQDAPSEWDAYARRVTAGLRAADVIAAPTRVMLAWLDAHYGPTRAPKHAVPNGILGDRLTPGKKRPVILAAGRLWDEAKNVAALDRAAARVPWDVRIAGSTQAPDGGEATFERATTLGFLEKKQLADEMAQASIYCLPCRYEPFGLSILEAARAGCALVLGDVPSLREVWGDAAIFVPPDDDERLARALAALAEDDLLRARMAERATKRSLDYTRRRMTGGTLGLYGARAPEVAA